MRRTYSVLIAEDELIIRTGIRMSLDWAAHGMSVVAEASDGLEAWRLYNELKPDIVLLDIRMPGLDGHGLIERIRAANSECYLLAITCMNDFETVYRATRSGISDYMLKTDMTPETLAAAMQKARAALDLRKAGKPSGRDGGMDASGIVPKWMIAVFPTPGEEANEMVPAMIERLMAETYRQAVSIHVDQTYRAVVVGGVQKLDTAVLLGMLEHVQAHYRRLFNHGISILHAPVARSLTETLARLAALYDAGRWLTGDAVCINPDESWLGDCQRLAFEYLMHYPSEENNEAHLQLRAEILRRAQLPSPCTAESWQDMLIDITLAGLAAASIENPDISKLTRMILRAKTAYREVDACMQFAADSLYKRIGDRMWRSEVRAAIVFIQRHYGREISVGDMARHVGLSTNYFSNLFRRESGMTPSAYLNHHRIGRAKELLRRTDLPGYEIAAQCGFADDGYFSRMFKQITGVPPSVYRQDAREEQRMPQA